MLKRQCKVKEIVSGLSSESNPVAGLQTVAIFQKQSF